MLLAEAREMEKFSSIYLRLAVGISFLSAVADGSASGALYGQPNVAWRNYSRFVNYTARLNWFLPAAMIPGLAIVAPVLGWKTLITDLPSGVLLTTFALTMMIALGMKAPFDLSVFSAAGGALLLGAFANSSFSLDELLRRNRQGSDQPRPPITTLMKVASS